MGVKLPPGDLNPNSYPSHLYLWSNYRTKGARWCGVMILKCMCLAHL